jgi:hypothetical protein
LKQSQTFSSVGENSFKYSKDRIKGAKNSRQSSKICPLKISEVEIQLRRDEESTEKAKEFQPLDLAQRTDNHWISEKVHEAQSSKAHRRNFDLRSHEIIRTVHLKGEVVEDLNNHLILASQR